MNFTLSLHQFLYIAGDFNGRVRITLSIVYPVKCEHNNIQKKLLTNI